MPGVPRLVRLAVPRSLAGLCATRTLSPAHPRVGQKPSSAYATRSLLAHGARDHRRPRAWPPATDTTDHAQPLPQPPPPRARPLATAHHRPRPAAGHGPPPTTPSRRPRPPPTTPSRCRSAQWVTSDEQPRVTSRKRRRAPHNRKNWLFTWLDVGGERTAAMLSIRDLHRARRQPAWLPPSGHAPPRRWLASAPAPRTPAGSDRRPPPRARCRRTRRAARRRLIGSARSGNAGHRRGRSRTQTPRR